jgi:hypothetical protein
MIKNVVPVAVACVFGVLVFDQPSFADDSPLKPVFGVGIGGEYSTWREADQSGGTLLRESGPRGTLSVSLDNLARGVSGFVYNLSAGAYVGNENYDGQTQSGIPITSNTGYLGGMAEVTGGYRFTNVLPAYSVDLTAALGADKWRRKISDTHTDTGTFVSGSEENYRIFYGRLGLGLRHVTNNWSHYVQFGAKRPFSAREEASLFVSQDCNTAPSVLENFVLHPKGSESFYLKWQINRLSDDKKRKYSMLFYYDSFQFDRSDTSLGQVTGCPAHQPDSHQNVFGAQVGYYFDLF